MPRPSRDEFEGYGARSLASRGPTRRPPQGSSWWRRALCWALTHDLRGGGTRVYCPRCKQSWGGGDPYP